MGPGGLTMTNQTRFNVGYAIAAIFLVFMIQYAVSVANQIAPIPYSDFQRLLHEGKIATVGVSDRFIQGSLKEPLPGGQKHFVATCSSKPARRRPPSSLSRNSRRSAGRAASVP